MTDVDVDLAQEVRQPTDVILVPVRQHDRADASALQVPDVREQQVDAEVLVARERETGVHDDDLVAELVDGHVLADLAEPAERDDPQRVAHRTESTDVRADEPSALEREDVHGERVAVHPLGMDRDGIVLVGEGVEGRERTIRLCLAAEGQRRARRPTTVSSTSSAPTPGSSTIRTRLGDGGPRRRPRPWPRPHDTGGATISSIASASGRE